MTDTASKSIEDLLKAVNDASGSARALFVTLMVLALYFLIVVSGTDDMALLRNATVAVPTLSNATLPARAFYICAPLVFVFLHLDLLIHLKLLSDKLFRFNQLLETSGLDEQAVRDYRLRLAGFPFSNWLGSDPRTGRRVHALQGAMVWLTLVMLPLTVLIAMQLGFLAYQSEAVTWLHRVALIVDAGLLLHFWGAFRYGRYRPADASPGFLFTEADKAWRRQVQRFRRWRIDTFYARTRYWHDVAGDRRRVVRMVRRTLPVLRLGLTAIGAPLGVALLLATVFGLWGSGHVVLSTALAFLCLIVGSRASTLLWSFILAVRQSAGDIAHGAWTFVLRRWPVLMPAAPLLLLSLTVATIPDEAADRASRWLYSWMEGGTRADDSPRTMDGLGSEDLARQIKVIRWSLEDVPESPEARSGLKSGLDGARCMRWLVAVLPGMPSADESLTDTPREDAASGEPAANRSLSRGAARKAGEGSHAQRKPSALAFHLENANRMPRSMRASCPTIALFHLKGGWFHRTLTVTGKVVARSDIKPDLAKDLRASLRNYRTLALLDARISANLAIQYDDLVAQIEGLDLSERSLRWANFTNAAFPKVSLDRAQLQYAEMKDVDLRSAQLSQSWMTGANMQDATLTSANLMGAELTGANVMGAALTDARMRGATLAVAYMYSTKLSGADMRRAKLTGAYMDSATLTRAILIDAEMTGATLRNASMVRADLSGATLIGADLTDARLIGANLSGATLNGANLGHATLTGAVLHKAFAKGTLFPMDSMRRRWMIVGDLKTGDYATSDVIVLISELRRLAAQTEKVRRENLLKAVSRLNERAGQPAIPGHFPDCMGTAPCGEDDARQRHSALGRAAHFESLICAPARYDAAGGDASPMSSREPLVLVWSLVSEAIVAVEPFRSAATSTLRRLEGLRCASLEAQDTINRWAAKNPPPAKDSQP